MLGFGFVLAVAATLVFGVRPALQHRRHQHTLANIARLEIELGYRVTDEQVVSLDQAIARAAYAKDFADGLVAGAVPPSERVFGYCHLCARRVALNAGRCRPSPKDCAKVRYLADQRSRD